MTKAEDTGPVQSVTTDPGAPVGDPVEFVNPDEPPVTVLADPAPDASATEPSEPSEDDTEPVKTGTARITAAHPTVVSLEWTGADGAVYEVLRSEPGTAMPADEFEAFKAWAASVDVLVGQTVEEPSTDDSTK